MSKTHKTCARALIEVCGSYPTAVDAVMALERALWALAFNEAQPVIRERFRLINEQRMLSRLDENLREQVPKASGEVRGLLMHGLEQAGLCWGGNEDDKCFHLSTFQPIELARALLSDVRPGHERRYFVMRNIRRHFRCDLSSHTAHLFHLLADAINTLQTDEGRGRDEERWTTVKPRWRYIDYFLPRLKERLLEDSRFINTPRKRLIAGGDVGAIIDLFIECCRSVGYLRAHYKSECISMHTLAIDAEYLLSHLFGMSTGVRGLDDLFGGGGLLLAEGLMPPLAEDAGGDAHAAGASADAPADAMPDGGRLYGRTTLIIGRFGTGKSLLSLQLAVEVARKGGVAWVMPLEQKAEEHLYTLESMGVLPKDDSVVIVTDVASAREQLEKKKDDVGVLIIVSTIKDSYNDFLKALNDNARRIERHPLRLICIDPFSAITRDPLEGSSQLRHDTTRAIDQIKQSGTNIVMVVEEDKDSLGDSSFEENIADTVIRLSVKTGHDYSQRFFEVTKSRLQREQPGEHPFAILPGAGITIYPSSAVVRVKSRARSLPDPNSLTQFGLPSLDNVLGEGAISCGDVICLHGHGQWNSHKLLLGMYFLLGADKKSDTAHVRSLLLVAHDNEASLRHTLNQDYIRRYPNAIKRVRDIRISSLRRGNIHPGYVIQRIEDELIRARQEGYWIDRILIDNISHWEMSTPFIHADETFGDTLVDFLRRHGMTSLIICGEPVTGQHSVIQRSVIDNANCVIHFERLEFRGKDRLVIRIERTRGMRHRLEPFDLVLNNILEVKPNSLLLRVSPNGQTTPVNVSLYLHTETDQQSKYHKRLVNALKATLSRNTETVVQDRFYLNPIQNLGHSSTVDELQVLQLDEFQVPGATVQQSQMPVLYNFPPSHWDRHIWDGFLTRLHDKIRAGNQSFFAIPYYVNVSLLAYRQDLLDEKVTASWRALADECRRWEAANPDEDKLFFEFPKQTAENYTCLFWEILLSLTPPPERLGRCRLREWLRADSVAEAGLIYRRLCRRAHLLSGSPDFYIHQTETIPSPINVRPDAVVWRHWYSTLNQMMYRPAGESDKQSSPLLNDSELKDVAGLSNKLRDAQDPLGRYLLGQFSPALRQQLDQQDACGVRDESLLGAFVGELNRLLKGPGLFDAQRFARVKLREEVHKLILQNPQGEALIRLNRLLLEEAFPDEIARHRQTTYLAPDVRDKIRVCPLPNGVAVAGEWFLGLPIYSAAPEVGLEIIKMLTTHEGDIERLQLGIGLPTRRRFYENRVSKDSADTVMTSHFSMDLPSLYQLVSNAFRRSDFGCYQDSFVIIAHHLKKIIEVPGENEDEVQSQIKRIIENLESQLELTRSDQNCSKCRVNQTTASQVSQ